MFSCERQGHKRLGRSEGPLEASAFTHRDIAVGQRKALWYAASIPKCVMASLGMFLSSLFKFEPATGMPLHVHMVKLFLC